MSSAPQSDDDLRERLRNRIGQKSDADENSEPTESEGDDMDDMDDDDEDDEDMESEADAPEAVEEGSQMIADAMGDDVAPGQVMELLEPLMGEDTRDDPAEMAGETGDAEADGGLSEAEVADVVDDRLDDKLGGVVTEDDLDAKLDDVVDALADETRDVMQKAEVGSTPSPTATGGPSGNTALFSDERGDD